MDKESVKNLKDNPYFKEFQEFVVSKIEKLDTVFGFDAHMSSQEVGELVRINAAAIEVLQLILEPFIDFNEKRKPTEEEISEAKAKVGL